MLTMLGRLSFKLDVSMPHKLFRCATAAAAICSCVASSAFAEDCKPADPDAFLPIHGRTLPPNNALPAPPTNNDCAFYNWAWHAFLFVTEKGRGGKPAFLNYPTIERAFPKIFKPLKGTSPALSVRNIEPALNEARSQHAELTANAGDPLPELTDGVMQASKSGPGFGAILVDQNRNPIFYTIHVNDEFAKFVRDNGLDEIDRLLAKPDNGSQDELQKQRPVPAELEFRPGVMEFKSAWMIIEGPVSRYSNYIVTRAKVPYLKNGDNGVIVDNSRPFREVNVALLSLHVVGAIDGHPEFIWATFEHADAQGKRDVAPAASANATGGSPPPIEGAARSYPLFHANTPPSEANNATPQKVGLSDFSWIKIRAGRPPRSARATGGSCGLHPERTHDRPVPGARPI
jgi:hypothetical protein